MIATRTVPTRNALVQVLEGGSGPDLVFLHGHAGLAEDDPFLLALARRFHVRAPLLPGYGASEEAPDIRDMLDVTLHSFDVIEGLGLSKPILAGHGLGGMIAAEMAAVAPNDIDRLCLIASAGLWLDDHPAPDLFSLLPRELPALMFHDVEAGTQLMTSNIDISDPAFLLPFLVTNARQLGMAGRFLFPIPERGLKDRIHRIKARTLLVWGDSDRIYPAPYAHAFKSSLKHADLVIIPNAGHMLTLEHPEAVAAAVGRLVAA